MNGKILMELLKRHHDKRVVVRETLDDVREVKGVTFIETDDKEAVLELVLHDEKTPSSFFKERHECASHGEEVGTPRIEDGGQVCHVKCKCKVCGKVFWRVYDFNYIVWDASAYVLNFEE